MYKTASTRMQFCLKQNTSLKNKRCKFSIYSVYENLARNKGYFNIINVKIFVETWL